MAALFDQALESGALAFAAPLLEGAAPAEVSGRVRSEHGAVYEIERRLGRGGMATVYLARDAKHDRRIAIKVIHFEPTARLGAQRFVQEIRVTARLQHPHVLALLDSGVFDGDAGALSGRPYYVMPYVEGDSLRDRLVREGALRVPDALRLLREVADALSYAHEQGVVHRDVKPENILLSQGHAVVADFGIAKAIAAADDTNRLEGERPTIRSDWVRKPGTETSTLLGTPAYMAPEQGVPGMRTDHRADLYAWGVVAYEALTGRRPFNERLDTYPNAHESIAAQATAVPRPIGELTPELPPAIGALVMRCLTKAPDDRPASAAAIVGALDATATLPRPSRVRHVWLRAAVVGVALTVVATVVSWRSGRAEPRRVVIGTGNAAIDVAAVQSAVDHADTVVLEGHLSFKLPATKRIAASYATGSMPPAAEVRVSRAVSISGMQSADNERTTIEGGTIPFYIDARGQRVAIRGLHFVQPTRVAILVHAADGLEIVGVRIERVVPFAHASEAIVVLTSADQPNPNKTETPEAISGRLLIQGDTIDASGGTPQDYTGGIRVWGVGQSPRHEVTLQISGTQIHNTTGSAIIVRRASGRVLVNANSVVTSVDGVGPGVVAIRLANTAAYVMANNVIECRWAKCVGIAVFSQFSEWPLAHAIVEDNVVNMAAPPKTVFGDSSAAIEIRGFVDSSVVRRNTLRGRARAAFVVRGFNGGIPLDNAFIDNRMDDFHGSVADVLVESGVVRTRLVRPGKVIDHGERTIIER
jgi:tRNA A-37 threonylcarbamoyl transferase component Bud32